MLNLTSGISPAELASAISGKLIFEGTKKIKGAAIDSRTISDGDLFVAVKGENTDGHGYISSAAKSGASAVLVERDDLDFSGAAENGCSVILVPNTVAALGLFAKKYKEGVTAKTVGVTGSVGKTTTRQFIYSVLSSELKTHRTEGNFNNELGLPLSVLKLDESYDASVLELGMSAKGEISYLTDIVRPDIAVITNIGTSHIEYLGSREGIRDAKLEIAEGLKPDGVLILNGDEPLLENIEGAVYVSLKNPRADYRAVNICYSSEGMVFTALCGERIIRDCVIPTLGEHTVLDAMYAVACGCILGLSDESIKRGLSAFEPVGMRQNIVKHKGVTYILDYYNASPESIKASLDVTKRLAGECGGRAIAVIGSVLELGSRSDELHRSIGCYAAEISCDMFYAFGKDACIAAEEAVACGMPQTSVFTFPDISDPVSIANAVYEKLNECDCVLLKASRSIHMERVSELLLEK